MGDGGWSGGIICQPLGDTCEEDRGLLGVLDREVVWLRPDALTTVPSSKSQSLPILIAPLGGILVVESLERHPLRPV